MWGSAPPRPSRPLRGLLRSASPSGDGRCPERPAVEWFAARTKNGPSKKSGQARKAAASGGELLGAGPGHGFAVQLVVGEAAVEEPHEAVGEGAEGLCVGLAAGAMGIVVRAFDIPVASRIIAELGQGSGTEDRPQAGQAAGPGVTLLSRLRNASEAADLDRALMMRQNAYLTSYSPEVLSEVRRVYYEDPRDESAVRHRLLKAVEDDAGRIHQGLTDVYKQRGWWGKVIEHARSSNENKATQYSGSGHIQFEGYTDTKSWGYEFRYPSAENDLRYHQARAAVWQEFLNAWRMSEMCRYGDTTFPNEVGAIDRSIRKLQSAYIDIFLFTPSGGIVTGVFHGQGDYVRAGEPVLRVESDDDVYLVGTVK
jgi:hypothetical protein